MTVGEDDFPQDVPELRAYLAAPQAGKPAAPVRAIPGIPGINIQVPSWLPGSGLYSAQLAAYPGLSSAFASHFAPDPLLQAVETYRSTYRPSADWPAPHAMVGRNVIVADTDDEAARLFTSIQQRFLGLQRGVRGPLPQPISPAELDALWTPREKDGVARILTASAVG